MEKELKNKERHIGYEVRTLDNMIGRRVNCWHSKMDEEVGITRMQAWIIQRNRFFKKIWRKISRLPDQLLLGSCS